MSQGKKKALVFLAILFGGSIWGITMGDSTAKKDGIIFLVLFVVILCCVVYFGLGKKTKCPSCGKRFALKKLEESIIDKENISVLMQTQMRNKNGEVTGTGEQYVPGVRYTYRVNYVCKNCKENYFDTYTRDVPKI